MAADHQAPEHRVLPAKSMVIAGFSTVVEWYDFTLYLYFATALSRVFYGGGGQSLLVTLGATYERRSAVRRLRGAYGRFR